MADPQTAARVRDIMASVFRIDSAHLPAEPAQTTVKAWDSLGHLRLILALESGFSVKFRSDRIPHLTSLPAILKELSAHERG